jgi:hypothetical protein
LRSKETQNVIISSIRESETIMSQKDSPKKKQKKNGADRVCNTRETSLQQARFALGR